MNTYTLPLAIEEGPKTVDLDPGDTFTWPIVTKDDEEAVLSVLRKGTMSELDVTIAFEEEFAHGKARGTRWVLTTEHRQFSRHYSAQV